jgi:hypothetical protein
VDQVENNTHSFIVKVWLEETAEEAGRAMWRGHITHVPDGERRYVQDLGDVSTFIVPYLQQMGVRIGNRRQVGDWPGRLRACFGRLFFGRL